MLSENSPLPVFTDLSDEYHMSLYKESINYNNSKLIEFKGDENTLNFLPAVIPQGINITAYEINPKNNIIEPYQTVNFKFNKQGKYKYDIAFKMNCVEDPTVISRIVILQLMNENNVVYNSGKMESFADLYTTSREIKLTGVVEHDEGDISKIGIIGFISNPYPSGKLLDFNIIDIDISIKKEL